MPAVINEANFENPDGPLKGSGPITRDSVIRTIPIEKTRVIEDEVEDDFDVAGGEETVTEEKEPIIEELEEVSFKDVGNVIRALSKRYGDSYLKWEPETLFMVLRDELREDFPDEIKERILAARTFAVNGPWKEWHLFEKAAIGCTGGAVVLGQMQYISPEDIARTTKLMREVSPNKKFSDEVLRYIAARLYSDNILWTGDAFPIECQKYIIELGASKALVDSCRERFKELADVPINKIKLSENLIDMQVGRILGIRHLVNE